jgi:hypothetical protein
MSIIRFRRTGRFHIETGDGSILNTVFYTPAVVNTPGIIDTDIRWARANLPELAKQPLLREKTSGWTSFARASTEGRRC